LMWGTLPIGSSILALLVMLIPESKLVEQSVAHSPTVSDDLALGRLAS